MHKVESTDRKEAALYWAAVSLIVCEGLPLTEAAQRLDLTPEELRAILQRRDAICATPDDELYQ